MALEWKWSNILLSVVFILRKPIYIYITFVFLMNFTEQLLATTQTACWRIPEIDYIPLSRMRLLAYLCKAFSINRFWCFTMLFLFPQIQSRVCGWVYFSIVGCFQEALLLFLFIFCFVIFCFLIFRMKPFFGALYTTFWLRNVAQ